MSDVLTTDEPEDLTLNARDVAFLSLEKCEKQQKYSNLEVDAAIDKFKLEGAEKGLYVNLVYGVIERKITLDFLLSAISTRPVCELDSRILTPLRMGLYQLVFMDKIPVNACVDESVKLAKRTSRGFGGFVNAVLRSFIRECGDADYKNLEVILNTGKFKAKYNKLGKYEKMSVLYSYPVWLCRKFTEDYSEEDAARIMTSQNGATSITLRVNTHKTNRNDLIDELSHRGIDAHPTKHSPWGIDVIGAPISKISDIIEAGDAFVQDEASQLAILALGAGSGETLIDCCACPGGKSFSSAIMMKNKGKVISCDLHKSKLSLIEKGAERLGLDIINVIEADSSKPCDALIEYRTNGADRVLCDVPCSGLGVIAKKPEVRYKNEEDIKRLPDIQYKILENCSGYVKPGGTLVYSTCTINPDENENNVAKFLKEHSEFEACDFEFDDIKSKCGMLTLLPHLHHTDGFFISVMKRIK